jgi:hypothetical protein
MIIRFCKLIKNESGYPDNFCFGSLSELSVRILPANKREILYRNTLDLEVQKSVVNPTVNVSMPFKIGQKMLKKTLCVL